MSNLFEFSIVFVESVSLTEELEDKVYGGRLADGQLSSIDGRVSILYEREANSLRDAVFGVFLDLKDAGLASKILCIDPSDLVSQVQIGKRLDRKRQQIHQYVSGSRGPGNFPKPVRYTEERKAVWSWAAVLKWFSANDILGINDLQAKHATEITMINSLLSSIHLRTIDSSLFKEIDDRFHSLVCGWEEFSTRIPWDLQGPVVLNSVPDDSEQSFDWAVQA